MELEASQLEAGALKKEIGMHFEEFLETLAVFDDALSLMMIVY